MPLPMVHLSVAKLLIEEHGLTPNNPGSFYLGSISPDAIHMRAGSTGKDKGVTHLNMRGMPDRQKYLEEFKQNNTAPKDDFELGYLVHVLTDVLWAMHVIEEVFGSNYAKDANPALPNKEAYYNDTDFLDNQLYATMPWRKDVWALLQNAPSQEMPGLLTAQEVDAWRVRTLTWFDTFTKPLNPIKYLSMAEIESFLAKGAAEISSLLKDLTGAV